MGDINVPMGQKPDTVQPQLIGSAQISQVIQQTLSLLTGYDGSARKLLRVSESGALQVISPRLKSIINVQADGDVDTYQGGNIKTSEVLIKAPITNVGIVWVNTDTAAAANVGYPLEPGDWIIFTIPNLINLHLLISLDDEWAVIAYTE